MSRRIALLTTSLLLLAATPAGAQELAGAWRFDEGAGGMARDDGPFGLHATWPAGAGPTWIAGVSGAALRFDGDDEVAIPDHRALDPPRITIAAWVRAAASPGAHRYVFSKGASSCTRSAYGLYSGPHGGAAFYVSGDGWFTLSPQVPEEAVWDGRWHRLTGVYDGARVRLYLDGSEVSGGTPGPTRIEYGMESRAPYIGNYHGDCSLPFTGDVDGLAVWGGPLTAARIAADAAPPAATPPATPAGGPVGRAPGAPAPGDPGFGARPGVRTTPPGCTSVALNRRSLRAGRRTRLVVTVRRGTARRAGVRVALRSFKLRRAGRTDARGRARFVLRPSRRQRRLEVKAAATRRAGCGTPVAYVHVRR